MMFERTSGRPGPDRCSRRAGRAVIEHTGRSATPHRARWRDSVDTPGANAGNTSRPTVRRGCQASARELTASYANSSRTAPSISDSMPRRASPDGRSLRRSVCSTASSVRGSRAATSSRRLCNSPGNSSRTWRCVGANLPATSTIRSQGTPQAAITVLDEPPSDPAREAPRRRCQPGLSFRSSARVSRWVAGIPWWGPPGVRCPGWRGRRTWRRGKRH
jgi:hypothetical protein